MALGKGKNCWETSPGNWAYSFNLMSRRYNGTLKGTTKRDAERFVRTEKERIKLELMAQAKASGGQGPRDMTFLAAVSRYVEECGQHAKAAAEDETHFDRLLDSDWIGENTMLTRVDDNLIAKLVAKRRAMYRHNKPHLGKLSNAYVNRTVTDLVQRVLTRARTVWKIPLPDEPNWAEHRLPEAVRVREMTVGEEIALEEASHDDHWAAIEFTLICGLRKTNVIALEWPQIDWIERIIKVKVKWDKDQEISITDELAEILKAQRGHHSTAVFTFIAKKTWTNPRNGIRYVKGQRYPITSDGMASAWRSLKKKAGVKNLTIHDLRKTTGSRIVRSTGNLAAASKQLGHSSIAITAMHYSHITTMDVRNAISKAADDRKANRAKFKADRDAESQKNLKAAQGRAA